MLQNDYNLASNNISKEQKFLLDVKIEKVSNWKKEKEIIGKILLELLYDSGAIKTWYRDKSEGWILNSGLWSPIYISLREISSKKNGSIILEAIGKSLSKLLINEIPNFDKVLGLATTGIQIITVITLFSNIPSLYTRKVENGNNIDNFNKLIKRHGEHKLIEGDISEGDKIVIVDDLVTKFNSVLLGREQLFYEAKRRNKNVKCDDVVVLLDREQGANKIAKNHNLNLYSLIKLKSNLHWLENKLSFEEYNVIKEYFQNYLKFQDPAIIKELTSLVI